MMSNLPPQSPPPPNKLMIRSEVLAVIRQMVGMTNPSKLQRAKCHRRLDALGAPQAVMDILVKELARFQSLETLQVVTELLMDLGELDHLHDPLWQVIQSQETPDESKDAANLILRHLGDESDPGLYLEYLQDPEGLIGRETNRMLEISAGNPEALIDFLDFILSLNEADQIKILSTLHQDYPITYLVNLYVPLLESDPAPVLWELLIEQLGESRSSTAAWLLLRLQQFPPERLPISPKLLEKALKTLKLAGAWKDDWDMAMRIETQNQLHPLLVETRPDKAYVTLHDGLGNQGVILSRARDNGDLVMISAAINDQHGMIDCFGFYQMSPQDFQKIRERFHENTTKVEVSPHYAAWKLYAADLKSQSQYQRIPYEYGCWRPLLSDLLAEVDHKPDLNTLPAEWIKPDWQRETGNLYQHPDILSWFLEQGDDPIVTPILQHVDLLVGEQLNALQPDWEGLIPVLDKQVNTLMQSLYTSPWRMMMAARLREAAYLMDAQQTHTFKHLAATAAWVLETQDEPPIEGFLLLYGRRCLAENVLRMRSGHPQYDRLTPFVDLLLTTWEV